MDKLNFLVLFSLFAGANLMVLFLILFFKKNNILPNKVLGVLIFIPCVVLITNPIMYLESFYKYSFLIILASCIAFLFGPFLLLYIYLVHGNTYQFKTKYLFHFLSAFIVLLYGFYVGLQSDRFIYENYVSIKSGENMAMNFIYFGQLFHFSIYIIWSLRILKQFKEKTKNKVTAFEDVNYKWLQFFVNRLLLLNVLILIIYIVQMSFFPSYIVYSDLLVTPLISLCFYPIIVYKSLSNHLVFDKQAFTAKMFQTFLNDLNKMKNSSDVKKGLIQQYDKKSGFSSLSIIDYIKNNKSYLKSDYTVFDLAKELKVSQRLLSDTINTQTDMSFSDLINEFRIKEAKILLKSKTDSFTIEAIAELSGFKSRSSFYRVFKNVTGLTPVQFIKK